MIQRTEYGFTGSVTDLPAWAKEPGMGFVGALASVKLARIITPVSPLGTPVWIVAPAPAVDVGKKGLLAQHMGHTAAVLMKDHEVMAGLKYEWLEADPSYMTGGIWQMRPEGKAAWRDTNVDSMFLALTMTKEWWPHTDVHLQHETLGAWLVRNGAVVALESPVAQFSCL